MAMAMHLGKHMEHQTGSTRRYFSVRDPLGGLFPAVEYWAATLDEEHITFEVVPLRRHIKLLGSGERLEEVVDGTFVGARSRRTFEVV